MDWQIAAILMQDGITSGAVYALLAIALVLVFSVTRIIFVPQGEFVAFGALTLAALQSGTVPQITWLLIAMGALVFVADLTLLLRTPSSRSRIARHALSSAAKNLAFPIALHFTLHALPVGTLPDVVQVLITLLLIVPMGPMLYRLAYQKLAEATTLVLLIVSVAVHFLLTGIGLLVFGAEGYRTRAFSDAAFQLAGLRVTGQSITVLLVSVILIIALYLYFGRTFSGKSLRATAVNRLGAKIVGIGTNQAGKLAFTLAAAIGVLSGVLIAPITTIFYDSGFLIGLKGFVGAIVGGLVSYPIAAAGALLVGVLEAFSSFWASAFKEVIVFTLIIPVLLWRSLTSKHDEDH